MKQETVFASSKLPTNWSAKRLKYAVSLVSDKGECSDSELPYIGLEHVESWTGKLLQGSCNAPDDDEPAAGTRFRTGDVLLGKLRPYLAKVHVAQHDGICSGELLVLRTKAFDSRFLGYMLLTPEFISRVDSSTYGAKMPRAGWSFIGNLRLPIPNVMEQRRIADFLDRETATLNRLIDRQEHLIGLLRDSREVTIGRAVTKGIDPNTPLKDSGLEWLGGVPVHWKVVQSRRYFRERKEKVRETDVQLTASQKYGVIYQQDFMRAEGQKVMQVIKGGDLLKHVEPNDFVISMRSFEGGIEWCRLRGCISSAYVVITPSCHVEPRFFAYLFKSEQYIQALQATSNLVRDGQALRFENFAQVPLPLLSLTEQAAIADFLEQETAKIDRLIANAIQAVDLLNEYCSAVITAAVTGQIEVRTYRKQHEETLATCQ